MTDEKPFEWREPNISGRTSLLTRGFRDNAERGIFYAGPATTADLIAALRDRPDVVSWIAEEVLGMSPTYSETLDALADRVRDVQVLALCVDGIAEQRNSLANECKGLRFDREVLRGSYNAACQHRDEYQRDLTQAREQVRQLQADKVQLIDTFEHLEARVIQIGADERGKLHEQIDALAAQALELSAESDVLFKAKLAAENAGIATRNKLAAALESQKRAEAERDTARALAAARHAEWFDKCQRAESELAAMRPVVEAVREYASINGSTDDDMAAGCAAWDATVKALAAFDARAKDSAPTGQQDPKAQPGPNADPDGAAAPSAHNAKVTQTGGAAGPTGWHAVGDDTAFAPPFGTIRVCECGALVAGGPTRCVRCAKDSGAADRVSLIHVESESKLSPAEAQKAGNSLSPVRYRHWKGDEYDFIGWATESTTGRSLNAFAVYRSVKFGYIRVRDAQEFSQIVNWPDGVARPRFTKVGDL